MATTKRTCEALDVISVTRMEGMRLPFRLPRWELFQYASNIVGRIPTSAGMLIDMLKYIRSGCDTSYNVVVP